MKISLCLATYNEEVFIHYPLDSAYDFVDEVILIDGGSTDKTVEIAKSYGDKVQVFSVDNPPMFHINKQRALDKAQGDWILQLDADEALTPELKNEIKNVIDNSDAASIAYWMPRKNFFLKRFLEKGGQYPDYTMRFYKRGAVRFPCKDVHENVEIISNDQAGYLKNPLLHYADPDFSRYLKRWDRYTTLEAELLLKKNSELCFFCYFVGKPIINFFLLYFRHRGYVDGFPGFVFALFSSIRFWAIYIKVWQKKK